MEDESPKAKAKAKGKAKAEAPPPGAPVLGQQPVVPQQLDAGQTLAAFQQIIQQQQEQMERQAQQMERQQELVQNLLDQQADNQGKGGFGKGTAALFLRTHI